MGGVGVGDGVGDGERVGDADGDGDAPGDPDGVVDGSGVGLSCGAFAPKATTEVARSSAATPAPAKRRLTCA
jgi:hypothetical protein